MDTRQGSRGVLTATPQGRRADEPRTDDGTPIPIVPVGGGRNAAPEPWVENHAPRGRLALPSVRELWRYRELGLVLAARDIRVRYKQTILGVAWVVIQPITAAVLFTVVFGRLAGLPSEGLPYAVFVFSGLVLWAFFSGTLLAVAQSLVQNRDLVTKTYLPALILPLAVALPGLVDLAVSLGVLGVVMVAYGVAPTVAVLLLPVWVVATALIALAVGVPLAALNVRYRDVRHTLGFILQIWLFTSPVVYAASLVEGGWRYLYALNPMTAALDGFRWSAVGGPAPGREALVSLAVGVVALVTGLLFFARAERRFADVI